MKKKTWIKVFIVIAIIEIIATVVTILVIKSAPDDTQKIAIATQMFGTERCTAHEGRELENISGGLRIPVGGMPSADQFVCVICHKQVIESSRSSYGQKKLCQSCADLTNRCRFCGRLRD